MTSVHVVIMAKAPRPGFAKTRLMPALGADGAASLARRLLEYALAQAHMARLGTIELCVTPASDALWLSIALPSDTQVTDQGEGDLGERMSRASARALHCSPAVLLMGTDCPALDAACLLHMQHALQTHDAVILPTRDGGYAALAFKQFSDALFTHVAWSTDTVAATTLDRMADLGWSVAVLPVVSDIDEPHDLAWVPQDWLETPHA